MREVSCTCNDTAAETVVGVLKQLAEVSANDQKRIIRIGGDEKIFETNDELSDVKVDGVLDTTPYVPTIRASRRKGQSINPPSISSQTSQVVQSVPSIVVANSGPRVSSADRQVVEDVVKEFVDSRRKFTAFDVTKEVRSRGVTARHGALKSVVREMFENDNMLSYVRELIEIDGVSVPPFLYLPNGDDPEDYFSDNNVNGHLVTA